MTSLKPADVGGGPAGQVRPAPLASPAVLAWPRISPSRRGLAFPAPPAFHSPDFNLAAASNVQFGSRPRRFSHPG